MKTLIIGAGVVGFNIADRLAAEGHDVTVIDSKEEPLERIKDQLDVRALRGFGSQPNVLRRGGIESADMVVAVTDSDEVNMVACLNASILGRSDIIKIARIREPNYCDDRMMSSGQIPIDLAINPERVTADKILGLLRYPEVTEIVEFAAGQVQLVGLRIAPTSPLAGMRLMELGERFGDLEFVVAALSRDQKVIIPRGSDVILPGDEVFLTFRTADAQNILHAVGIHMVPVNRVLILGGTRVGQFLAKRLVQSGAHPKIIESDAKIAQQLSEDIPDAVVLEGSPTDADLLMEENAGEMQAVITCSNREEVNVMAALLTRRMGPSRIITTTSRIEYGALIKSIGVNACLSPRHVAVSSILRFIRHGRVVAVQAIGDEQAAEALEFEAQLASDAVDIPIHDLRLPPGSIIAALVHADEVIIPRGNTVIKQGDHVVVLAQKSAIHDVENLLQRRVERN